MVAGMFVTSPKNNLEVRRIFLRAPNDILFLSRLQDLLNYIRYNPAKGEIH